MLLKMVLVNDEILTPEQLAERLGVSIYWVQEQTRERTRERLDDPLPYHKVGKFVRFNWREICEWQTRHEVKGGTQCVTKEVTSRSHTAPGSVSGTKTSYSPTAVSPENKSLVN